MKTLVQISVAICVFFLVTLFPHKVGTLAGDGLKALFNISVTVGKNAPTPSTGTSNTGSTTDAGAQIQGGGRSARVHH